MMSGLGRGLLISILGVLLVLDGFLPTVFSTEDFIGSIDVFKFLPDNGFPWLMFKSDVADSFHSDSMSPRYPRELFVVNVSANLMGKIGYPLVDGRYILLGSSDSISLYDDVSGRLLWSRNILDEFNGEVAAYVLGDNVYVATSGRFDEHGESIPALLIALDKVSGEPIWVREIGGNQSSVTSNMILFHGRLVFGTIWADSRVYCFDTGGNLLWMRELYGIGNIRGIAVGGGKVYVTGENGYMVYGIRLVDGVVSWVYKHDSLIGTPVYSGGRVYMIDADGDLVCLSAENGKPIFVKEVYGQTDVDGNSLMSIGGDGSIYIIRRKGGLVISKLDKDGNLYATYNLNDVDLAGYPLSANRMILLPSLIRGGSVKLFFFWDDLRLVNELEWDTDESFVPSVSIYNASIYFVYAYDGVERLVKLVDNIRPTIINVSKVTRIYENTTIDINATLRDSESGLYRVVLVYRVNGGEPQYLDMSVLRKYLIEPAGGYGLNDEPYVAYIPPQRAGSRVEYLVLAVDNAGNFVYSDVYSFEVLPKPTPYSQYVFVSILVLGGAIIILLILRYYKGR